MPIRISCVAALLLLAGCAGVEPLFTHGVASGDLRGDSAVLWTRTREAASVVAQVARTPDFRDAVSLPPVNAAAASDFTAKALASSLEPGARYYYRFKAGDTVSDTGRFRTPYAPDDRATVRMAFTGDADWRWKPYPLLASLAEEDLDFFLFLGDLIYEHADIEAKAVVDGLEGYRAKYRENREPRPDAASAITPLRDLYAAFGQYAVFDNHELGLSPEASAPRYTEGGARVAGGFVNGTRGFAERLRAYTEYQPVREERHEAAGDARFDGTARFYRAIAWGANVELIVLDDRSYRDARIAKADAPEAGGCDRTMLGAVQLAWFEQALLAAQRRGAVWKAVVISSPIQELGRASQVGEDLDSYKGWAGNYRCERSRILRFIDENAIDNVVFLTTDYHMTIVNNLFYEVRPGEPGSPRKPARNAFEVMTGPLGAIAGWPLRSRIAAAKLPPREADETVVALLNRDLERAGLDPVGLERDFPGLDVASIRAAGRTPGVADPLAFVAFGRFTYAVLAFEASRLHVQVKSIPYVADPRALLDAGVEREYEARRATEAFSFTVRAR
jgi:alkaline phosphatase D